MSNNIFNVVFAEDSLIPLFMTEKKAIFELSRYFVEDHICYFTYSLFFDAFRFVEYVYPTITDSDIVINTSALINQNNLFVNGVEGLVLYSTFFFNKFGF
jgi:hypothetical protein